MIKTRKMESQIAGSLWGSIVGDALGVPAEFKSRNSLSQAPITDMVGYGTHHQPAGTWSDDSSMILCTMESLTEIGGVDGADLARRYLAWLMQAHWTPHGEVFDIGIATRQALARFAEGKPIARCGGRQEFDNGNGSLMRIIPVSLWFWEAGKPTALEATHLASLVTHAHPRSQIACGFFTLLVRALLGEKPPLEALGEAWRQAEAYYIAHEEFLEDWPHFSRLSPEILPHLPEAEVRASGYCVHTLEASIWCLLQEPTFAQAVLRAVNLGEDTDTTGCVTGALAGLAHGLESIPTPWIDALARHSDLQRLIASYMERMPAL